MVWSRGFFELRLEILEGSVVLTDGVMTQLSIVPGHEDECLRSWERAVEVRVGCGFELQNAFIETGPGVVIRVADSEVNKSGEERILTSLYRCDGDVEVAERNFRSDAKALELAAASRDYLVRDEETRRVASRLMKPPSVDNQGRMIVMRRYDIQNDWNEFIDVWKMILPVREEYGFECLFAVEDTEEKTFFWAFTYDGDSFSEFMRDGQKAYYADPRRVELETVNNYLAEVRLTPSRQLMIDRNSNAASTSE